MKDNRIEDLFRNGLQNSESDVPAGTWKAIENSLDSMMPTAGAASQPASSLGTLGKAIIGGVIVSGIALTFFLFNSEKIKPVNEPSALVERIEKVKDEVVIVETVTDIQKPKSIAKMERVNSQSVTEETGSHETFTANDEIKPLADQSESITKEAQAVVTTSELKEPFSEISITEAVDNNEETTEPVISSNSEQIVAETSQFPEVSFNDVITPNLDNVNDIFRVEGNEAVASFTVTVMNLNGKVIHQWSAPNGFWDGRLENGQMAPTGKYLVDIFVQPVKGAPYHKPVTIQLIR